MLLSDAFMIAFSVFRTALNASTRKLIHAGIIIRQMSRLTGLSKTLKTCWYNGMAKRRQRTVRDH